MQTDLVTAVPAGERHRAGMFCEEVGQEVWFIWDGIKMTCIR